MYRLKELKFIDSLTGLKHQVSTKGMMSCGTDSEEAIGVFTMESEAWKLFSATKVDLLCSLPKLKLNVDLYNVCGVTVMSLCFATTSLITSGLVNLWVVILIHSLQVGFQMSPYTASVHFVCWLYAVWRCVLRCTIQWYSACKPVSPNFPQCLNKPCSRLASRTLSLVPSVLIKVSG